MFRALREVVYWFASVQSSKGNSLLVWKYSDFFLKSLWLVKLDKVSKIFLL
jgi:hypothetical protein